MMRAVLLLLSVCAPAAAQIGWVDAVVIGRDGRRLAGLKRDDFEVFQDGKPREIADLSYIEEEPLRTLVVLVDDLALEPGDFTKIREGIGRFVDEEMRPGDRVSLVYVSHGSGALRQLHSDRTELRRVLDLMYRRPPAAATALLGDIPLAGLLREVLNDMAGLPGRKSLVVISPGKRVTQSIQVRAMAELANDASTVVYANGGGLLVPLVEATGGFGWRDPAATFERLREVVAAGYYRIGWNPGDRYGGDPRIRIRMRDTKLHVRARDGFLRDTHVATPGDPLRHALVSPLHSGDLAVRLTSSFVRREAAGSYVDLRLHIAPKGMQLERGSNGCWTARIEVALALRPLDPGLAPSERVSRHSMEQKGCEEASGFVVAVRERVPLPGAYQVRAAVRNAGDPATGSAAEFLMIPEVKRAAVALSGLTMWAGEAPPEPAGDPAIWPAADRDPAVRLFAAGDSVRYAFHVFGKANGVRARVLRDGREVMSTAADGVLTGLPPGRYVLHVSATRRSTEGADQFLDFEMR
jgi:hypothetical protein